MEYDASEEVRQTALKAARLAGFDFCGVDVIEAERGPIVVEINSSPGCEPKDSEVLGVDINDKVLQLLKRKTLEMKRSEAGP